MIKSVSSQRLSVAFRHLITYKMLNTSQSSIPTTAIILDLLLDNWTPFLQAFKLQCTNKFGAAGQQIITDKSIPLNPFASPPTKFDLEKNAAGNLLPNQFGYPRRQLIADESENEAFDPSPITLSDRGSTELRADLKIYHEAANKFYDFDTAPLDYIYSHISLASHTAIRAHTSFPAYQLLEWMKARY
jgi:hypothetical protein